MIGTFCTACAVIILTIVLFEGQVNDFTLNLGIVFSEIKFQVSFLVYTLIVFALGVLSCSLLSLGQFFDTNGRYKKLKKQFEKTNLSAADADEKIELLENKIKTLEAALKSQIEK